MNVLIVGCGRVGAELANSLYQQGHDISIIDRNEENFELLCDDFEGIAICGIPIDNDKLKEAGIANCDVVCSVTDDDNVNIMVAELAKKLYNVNTVIARVFTSAKGERFTEGGIRTVCSTALTADAILSAIDDYNEEQYVHFGEHTIKFFSFDVPKQYVGRKVNEIEFEDGEELYAFIHEDGSIKKLNNYNIEMKAGDKLLFTRLIK